MAEYKMLEDNIGYLNIMQFSGNAYDKFKEAMDFFEEQGAKGVVIDLRDNPGGYLNVVVDMLDDILPEGTLVYTEDKYGKRETEYSGPDSIDMQFTVLVNGNTASASEIFAGAMQDYEYGAVVGTTTYGKGVVQAVLPMDDTGAGLKLTISEYFTPNGRNINGKGIEPDEYIEDDSSGEDVQMDKAVSVLKDRIG
jgi:carboxyl-terminal processing protease